MITVGLIKDKVLQAASVTNPRSPFPVYKSIIFEKNAGRLVIRGQSNALIMDNYIDVDGQDSWFFATHAEKIKQLIQRLPDDYAVKFTDNKLVLGKGSNWYEMKSQADVTKSTAVHAVPDDLTELPFDMRKAFKNAYPFTLKTDIMPVLNTVTLYPQDDGLFAAAADGNIVYERRLSDNSVIPQQISIDNNIMFTPGVKYSVSPINKFNKFFIVSEGQVIIHSVLPTKFPVYRDWMTGYQESPPITFDSAEMESALQRLMVYAKYSNNKAGTLHFSEEGVRITTKDDSSGEECEEFVHTSAYIKKEVDINLQYLLLALTTLGRNVSIYLNKAVYLSNKSEIITIMPLGRR